jgi:hypothetical protein
MTTATTPTIPTTALPEGCTFTTTTVVAWLRTDGRWEPAVEVTRLRKPSGETILGMVSLDRYYNEDGESIAPEIGHAATVARFDDPQGEFTEWYVSVYPDKWLCVTHWWMYALPNSVVAPIEPWAGRND